MANQARIERQEKRYQAALSKVGECKPGSREEWRAMESAAVALNMLTVIRMEEGLCPYQY